MKVLKIKRIIESCKTLEQLLMVKELILQIEFDNIADIELIKTTIITKEETFNYYYND